MLNCVRTATDLVPGTVIVQAEGWARDFVRLVRAARKEMRLHVADRIELAAFVAPVLKHALHEHRGRRIDGSSPSSILITVERIAPAGVG
jgi:hypothetical protein